MLKHWKGTLSLLAVAAAVALVSAGLALGKKPPKPPPEPPPTEPTVSYSISVLQPLLDDTKASVTDLNNFGEAVGWSRRTEDGGNVTRAVVWNASGGVVALNDLIAHPDSQGNDWNLRLACGINDLGQICGSGYLNGVPEERAFRFTPGVDGAPGVVDDLGTLGGNWSRAIDINELGEVAGNSYNANGDIRAFVVYTDENGDLLLPMTDIGDLGGNRAQACAINNDGQVAGLSLTSEWEPGSELNTFRYTPGDGGLPGVMEDLGTVFWGTPPASDINDSGDVAGGVLTGDTYKGGWPVNHAFVYTDHLIDLGTLGGYNSGAYGINSEGEVVGWSREYAKKDWPYTPAHGFLYTNKTDTEAWAMFKLEDLIDILPPDYQGPIRPKQINDSGEICAEADGQAILLTPLP